MSASFVLTTIDDGAFKGASFRCTNDIPQRVAVVDWIQAVAQCSYVNARQLLCRIKSKYPELFQSQVQFEGQGQIKVWVADAVGLLAILDKLPRKYVAQFQKERDTLLARYFGGDTSMADEVHAIRQAQQAAPHTHGMRVFGEAVEHGQIGNLQNANAQCTTTINTAAIEWHGKRDLSKEKTKEKSAAIKDHMPDANCGTYARTNARICKAVTGMNPGQLKVKAGVKKYKSARDLMTTSQLGVVCVLEEACKNLAGPDMEANFNKAAEFFEQGMKMSGLHGVFIKAPPKLSKEDKLALMQADEHTREQLPPSKRPKTVLNNIKYYMCNVTNAH